MIEIYRHCPGVDFCIRVPLFDSTLGVSISQTIETLELVLISELWELKNECHPETKEFTIRFEFFETVWPTDSEQHSFVHTVFAPTVKISMEVIIVRFIRFGSLMQLPFDTPLYPHHASRWLCELLEESLKEKIG